MHCSRKSINRRNALMRLQVYTPPNRNCAKKLPAARTNRLRASQIAASLLVDFSNCRYSL